MFIRLCWLPFLSSRCVPVPCAQQRNLKIPPNSGGIASWVADLNATLCLVTRTRKIKNILFPRVEIEPTTGYTLVPLRHDWPQDVTIITSGLNSFLDYYTVINQNNKIVLKFQINKSFVYFKLSNICT